MPRIQIDLPKQIYEAAQVHFNVKNPALGLRAVIQEILIDDGQLVKKAPWANGKHDVVAAIVQDIKAPQQQPSQQLKVPEQAYWMMEDLKTGLYVPMMTWDHTAQYFWTKKYAPDAIDLIKTVQEVQNFCEDYRNAHLEDLSDEVIKLIDLIRKCHRNWVHRNWMQTKQ